MAKTATDIPITQGSGVNLSNFALASGRRRQTVIIADADDAGEALLVELPVHDAPDRGSSIKIGGRALGVSPAMVSDNDRVDAWFTPYGELNVVNSVAPGFVYDGGRRTIGGANVPATQATSQLLPAAGSGLKNKLLAVNIVCSNITTPGQVYFTDGVGGTSILTVAWIAAKGNYSLPTTGTILLSTSANTALGWSADAIGASNFSVYLNFYTAP